MDKPKNKNNNKKEILITSICILFSLITGIYSNDILVGGSLLASGLLSSYLASIGKKSNYIFGFINALLIAYVAYQNNLFGSFAANILIFAPLEFYGFFAWKRNSDNNKKVKIRKFTLKDGIIITSSCAIGSILLGYILSLIPNQQLAFMDSTISCIDICALILMNLRFKESWWLWVLSGILSIIVWAIALSHGGSSALMRLLASIGFLIINAYGAVKWSLNKKVTTIRKL